MNSPTELPNLQLEDKDKEMKIKQLLKDFVINDENLQKLKLLIKEEAENGLAKTTTKLAFCMENTYVSELIDGHENGEYIGIDLGGTNLRVIYLQVKDGKITVMKMSPYDVPEEYRFGSGKYLFDHIARSIEKFMLENNIQNKKYKLGFTYSYPLSWTSVRNGIMIQAFDTFQATDIVGKDVGDILEDSIKKCTNLQIEIVAVTNDTAATVVYGNYLDKNCYMCCILGTGNNGCYFETLKGDYANPGKKVIIDPEWGLLGDKKEIDFIRTKWDKIVDKKSNIEYCSVYEKMVGGMAMDSLLYEVLLSLQEEGIFPKMIGDLKNFSAKDFTTIETEAFSGNITESKRILEDKIHIKYSLESLKIIQYICGLITYRSCLLNAVSCAYFLDRMNLPQCTIAVEGSLYKYHPRYEPLTKVLLQKHAPHSKFSLLTVKDGSGIGAALLAAIEDGKQQK